MDSNIEPIRSTDDEELRAAFDADQAERWRRFLASVGDEWQERVDEAWKEFLADKHDEWLEREAEDWAAYQKGED